MITITLILIAGLSNGLMDAIAHHDIWASHWFWGLKAWRNSYKDGIKDHGPAFWGADTWLAWTRSGWHLCKMIMIESICVAIMLLYNQSAWISLVIYGAVRLTFFGGFWITYTKIKT